MSAAYILVYWGGAGQSADHLNDCYLRQGSLYEFRLQDESSVLATFSSFDGTALEVETNGETRRFPASNLDQIFPAPGYGAWGLSERQ